MKQALILCGGKARRLRPYSYILPKASMPFLNLPLLSLGWFYLEYLGVSQFLLNAHLFPEKLKQTVDFLFHPEQKTEIFFEEELLGGAGTLYKLKDLLQKEKSFFYLNGDSLFFPSDKKQLPAFEEDFLKSGADGSFFVFPLPVSYSGPRALYCDEGLNLKCVGAKQNQGDEFKKLLPFHFTGLALFKSSLLENVKRGDIHLFQDLIKPLLKNKTFKVFVDETNQILEAGDKQSYIESMKFCLDCLFEADKHTEKESVRTILEECFARFDPNDQIVGLTHGKTWSKRQGWPLLVPKSVRGLEHLELQGPSVLGPGVHLFGKSSLKDSVLGSHLSWKGSLDKDIVIPEKVITL